MSISKNCWSNPPKVSLHLFRSSHNGIRQGLYQDNYSPAFAFYLFFYPLPDSNDCSLPSPYNYVEDIGLTTFIAPHTYFILSLQLYSDNHAVLLVKEHKALTLIV